MPVAEATVKVRAESVIAAESVVELVVGMIIP
jgi:hypothetical protein